MRRCAAHVLLPYTGKELRRAGVAIAPAHADRTGCLRGLVKGVLWLSRRVIRTAGMQTGGVRQILAGHRAGRWLSGTRSCLGRGSGPGIRLAPSR